MPTSGKSYLGERLAKDIGFSWVDFDHEIQRRCQHAMPLADDETLLRYEEETISDAMGVKTVFSCGGSAVYSMPAMEHLGSISEIVYLATTNDILKQREVDYIKRGVIGAQKKTIEQLHHERQPLYECYADYTIDPISDIEEQYAALLLLAKQLIKSGQTL